MTFSRYNGNFDDCLNVIPYVEHRDPNAMFLRYNLLKALNLEIVVSCQYPIPQPSVHLLSFLTFLLSSTQFPVSTLVEYLVSIFQLGVDSGCGLRSVKHCMVGTFPKLL